MIRRLTILLPMFLFWTSACSVGSIFSLTPTPTQYIYPTAVTPDIPALTVDVLRNAEYNLPGFGGATFAYQLKDGKYSEGDPSMAGYVNLSMLDLFTFGDLNQDGVNDAAVLIGANYGGTGVFVSLNAVLNDNGQPRHAAWYMVDDRPQVKLLDIRDGEIYMEAIVHAFEDPACCPNLPVTRSFKISGVSLMLVQATSRLANGQERSITINSPADGMEMGGNLVVNGSVTTLPFENTLTLRVYNEQGNELFISPVQVTDAGGTGRFSITLDLNTIPLGRVRIVVADLNAADGSVLALDSVEMIVK